MEGRPDRRLLLRTGVWADGRLRSCLTSLGRGVSACASFVKVSVGPARRETLLACLEPGSERVPLLFSVSSTLRTESNSRVPTSPLVIGSLSTLVWNMPRKERAVDIEAGSAPSLPSLTPGGITWTDI